MSRFAEANSAHIKIAHIAVLAPTALTSTNDTTGKLRYAF